MAKSQPPHPKCGKALPLRQPGQNHVNGWALIQRRAVEGEYSRAAVHCGNPAMRSIHHDITYHEQATPLQMAGDIAAVGGISLDGT